MGRPGFEPGTNRLKAEYSTVELATLVAVFFDTVDYYNIHKSKVNLLFSEIYTQAH
jgi:hypothetical protein